MFIYFAYVFFIFAWTRAFLRYRDGSISIAELILWSLVWLSAGAVLSWPGFTDELASRIGISRGSDAVVYTSIIFLFYLIFRLYIKISDAEKELTRLIRAMALKDLDK